jgi:nitrite reductase/ring-hydroxylating ferredoxin subunit
LVPQQTNIVWQFGQQQGYTLAQHQRQRQHHHQPRPYNNKILLLHAKQQSNKKGSNKNKEDPSNDESKGFLKTLMFWSSKEEDDTEDEKAAKKLDEDDKDKDQGWFRFFNRGDDNSTAVVQDEQEKSSGGFIKGIKDRFSSNDDSQKNADDNKESKTKRTFQRRSDPTKKEQPQKRRTLRIPRGSSTGAGAKKDKQLKQVSEPADEDSSKWSSFMKRKKEDGTDREQDRLKKEDKEDSESILGRFQQRFFGNNTAPDKLTEEERLKDSSNTRSVAQKYFSSFVDNTLPSIRKSEEQWIPVCPKTRISPGEIVPVEAAGLELILVASKDGNNIYCMVNSCPHLGTPLETGILERRPIESRESTDKNDASSSGGDSEQPATPIQESDVAAMLASDGCEDCIVCPLHRTAFSLSSGEVRGEWCPYPPVLGKMMSTVKQSSAAAVFDVRTRGKNIEVRINTPLKDAKAPDKKGQEKGRDNKDDTSGGKTTKLVI